MTRQHIEKELKAQLKEVDKKLRRAENLDATARFGSAVGIGLALSTMTYHVFLLLGITMAGIIFNLAAKWFFPQKNS